MQEKPGTRSLHANGRLAKIIYLYIIAVDSIPGLEQSIYRADEGWQVHIRYLNCLLAVWTLATATTTVPKGIYLLPTIDADLLDQSFEFENFSVNSTAC